MRIARRIIAIALVLALALAVGACTKKQPEGPKLEPKIAPPLIGKAGVLKVGVDYDYPPFSGAGLDGQTGLDVDIAAAVAERLGLTLELVDVPPSELATALAEGRVDIALGATSITEAVLAEVSTAGSYLIDGPAFYSVSASPSVAATITIDVLPTKRVATQKESLTYWNLEYDFGAGFAMSFDTLREAFDAVQRGEADVVAGDAAVCAYIARDYPGMVFSGQYGPAQPLGIAVRKDAPELEAAIRGTLDSLASEGVLDNIVKKWLGNFPKLTVETAP